MMDKNITDFLGLSKKEIFQIISKNLPDDVTEPQNIIECKDDILFIWNAKDCCVLSLNIQAATCDNREAVKHQTLLCTNPPCIRTVLSVRCSLGGSWLGLFGEKGVSLLELPRRWGPNGDYSGGRESVTCRTLSVDERYFSSGPLAALVQARWHPGSPTDSHLMILTAENSLRLYDADSCGISLLQVWQIGARPSAMPPTSSKLPFLAGLGDTAVDFDFLSPELTDDNKLHNGSSAFLNQTPNHTISSAQIDKTLNNTISNESLTDRKVIHWPIAVLNGCGDVFIVSGRFDTHKPYITKPLAMLPATSDNYGLDCCSLLVLQSEPPVLVIAGSKGVLHHCVLMSEELDTNNDLTRSDHTLYVLESVELQLGLDLSSAIAEGPHDSCPLRLLRDDIDPARYLVYHSAGVHAVTVPAVQQLQEFLELDEVIDPDLHAPALNTPCSAEYLLCTKFSRNSKTLLQNQSTPYTGVLGITIFGSPPTLIALLADGQVVSLPLTSVPFAYTESKYIRYSSGLEIKSPLKKMLKEPFDQHIRRILKPKITQPIMKLGDGVNMSQSYDAVTRAFKILREEYFTKHDEARQEIEKRVHALRLLKKQQLLEIKRLTEEKAEIQNRAEKLAEKCEDVHERQESLTKRAEMVLRLASQRLPKITQAEREFFNKLKNAEKNLNNHKSQLTLARKNINRQRVMIQQYENQDKKKDMHLGEKRIEAIKQNLQERTAQITQLVKDVKLINSHLDLI